MALRPGANVGPYRIDAPLGRGVVSADGEAYAHDYGRFLQDLYLVEGLR